MTPLLSVAVPAGAHQLVLRNTELKLERTVRVKVIAGAEAVVKEDLAR